MGEAGPPSVAWPSRGPGALRTLRELKGLTQANLAQRSGVSVRTIRLLENGKIESPRASTLDALAAAAALTPPEAASFRRAWAGEEDPKPFSSLGSRAAPIDQVLAEAKFHIPRGLKVLAMIDRTTIGHDRTTALNETECVYLASREEVSRAVRIFSGDQAVDVCAEEFEAVNGCRLLDTVGLAERNMRVYYLALDPPLAPGDQRLVRFRRHPRPSALPLADSDGQTVSSTKPIGMARVEAIFQGERPSRLMELRARPNEDHIVVREVAVDAQGLGSVTRINLSAGDKCGLTWEW